MCGAIYGSRGIIWANMVQVNQVMLPSKYQDSRPYGYRQEEFFMFLLYKPLYNMWPPEWGNFWPQGYILNKLDRGPLSPAEFGQILGRPGTWF